MRRREKMMRNVLILLLLVADPLSAAPTTKSSEPGLPPHTIALRNVRYGDGPGTSNLLDIYMPDSGADARPLIVWVHGGGWSEGDKQGCASLPMVARGYIAASINYRLTKQAIYPAQIQDCKGAIRFLRAHAKEYRIDPNRIGVWGASAGGHLVALLGTSADSKDLEGNVGGNLDQSSKVQAVCDWFGPTDLSVFADQALAAGIMKTTSGPPLIMALLGGGLQQKKDLVKLANPISFINKKTADKLPPFLIMHGDKDNTVPLAQSQLLNDALKNTGAATELQVIKGAGHGTGFNTPKITKSVADFFDANLKPT